MGSAERRDCGLLFGGGGASQAQRAAAGSRAVGVPHAPTDLKIGNLLLFAATH